jgi:hypothetical protein
MASLGRWLDTPAAGIPGFGLVEGRVLCILYYLSGAVWDHTADACHQSSNGPSSLLTVNRVTGPSVRDWVLISQLSIPTIIHALRLQLKKIVETTVYVS